MYALAQANIPLSPQPRTPLHTRHSLSFVDLSLSLLTADRAARYPVNIVDGLVLDYVPSTTLPAANPAQSPMVAAILSAGEKQQLFDSRRVVLACISLGAIIGLVAARIMKSHLLYSSLASGFFGAYLATLSNRLGKTVRFIGVIFVSLLSRLVNFIREQYRAARFTYQTGKWFERLDTTMQKFDGTLGSPSQKLDGMAKFVASEVTRSGAAISASVEPALSQAGGSVGGWLANTTGVIGSWGANTTQAIGSWGASVGTSVDSTIRLSDGISRIGSWAGALQADWFADKEETLAWDAIAQWNAEVPSLLGKRAEEAAAAAAAALDSEDESSGDGDGSSGGGGGKIEGAMEAAVEQASKEIEKQARKAGEAAMEAAQRSYEQASKEMMGRFGYSPEGNDPPPGSDGSSSGRGGGGTPPSGNGPLGDGLLFFGGSGFRGPPFI